MTPWNTMADALVARHGEKVYKLPVSLPITCPNRDGCVGVGGCTFCGAEGGSFENEENSMPVKEQLAMGRKRTAKYKSKKYIAYFQNFSNTYLPMDTLREHLYASNEEDIVGVTLSTRPDCFTVNHAIMLSDFQKDTGKEVTVEFGLQTVNPRTLEKVNRGHSVADFVRAQLLLNRYGLRSCVHMILNFPWDTTKDVIEGAKLISTLDADEVKLHALYIVKGTRMGTDYANGAFEMKSVEQYKSDVIAFIRHLHPEMIVQRVIGRAPEENSLFCNWNMSWWKIRDEIIQEMVYNGWKQGDLFSTDQGIEYGNNLHKN